MTKRTPKTYRRTWSTRNIEANICNGNMLVQQGRDLLDPTKNVILDQKNFKISIFCYTAEKPILSRMGF